MADKDGTVMMSKTIISAVVGVIILCSFAIPTIIDQVTALSVNYADASKEYGDMIKMTILFLIVGLILFIVRSYNNSGR